MSELWLRIGLVAGLLAVAAIIIVMQHRRRTSSVRTVKVSDLAPGTYFFSSATCSTCIEARAKLDSSLGPDGYEEFAWESQPEVFDTHGVDQVPATLVVGASGRGRLYFGQRNPP